MDTRILRKLHKKAHDMVRLVPENEGFLVQFLSDDRHCWIDARRGFFSREDYIYRRDSIVGLMDGMRRTKFEMLANRLLYKRRVKRLSRL